MRKIQTIVAKEWAEVFKNKLVLFTVAFLPLILTALPLVMLAFTASLAGEIDAESNAELARLTGDLCIGLEAADCTTVYTLNIFTLMFMILPVAIPVTIASYSIVGEKTAGSLEPLLATRITVIELLLAKGIAAVVPAIAATWAAFIIYLIGVRLMVSAELFRLIVAPHWILAIVVVGPLLAILAVNLAIAISSRASDPRVAEQLSALVILPLIMLLVGQSVGLLLVDRQIILLMAAIVLVVDVALAYLSVRLFQRETILTRWK